MILSRSMYISSYDWVLIHLDTSLYILDLNHRKDRDLWLLSFDNDPFSIFPGCGSSIIFRAHKSIDAISLQVNIPFDFINALAIFPSSKIIPKSFSFASFYSDSIALSVLTATLSSHSFNSNQSIFYIKPKTIFPGSVSSAQTSYTISVPSTVPSYIDLYLGHFLGG